MMHDGKQSMRSMCSVALLVSKPGVPRFQRSPNSKQHHPRCNAGEKKNVGGKPCNARTQYAKGIKVETENHEKTRCKVRNREIMIK